MSAASMAIFVPDPTATPTVAVARAAASLMPSPTIIVGSVALRMAAAFSSGVTPARTCSGSMPMRPAMSSAASSRSPESILADTPSSCSAEIAADASCSGWSCTSMRPMSMPSTVTAHAASASRRTSTAWPSTVAVTPLPGTAMKSVGSGTSMDLAVTTSLIARATGCSLSRSAAPATRSNSSSLVPGSGEMVVTMGLPSVSVPVLSKTTRVIRPARSSAAADLIRMPRRPASPVPTMMAMGVASPSAHGHEMMRTVTIAMMPVENSDQSSRTAARIVHPPIVSTAMASTAGTKMLLTLSAIR